MKQYHWTYISNVGGCEFILFVTLTPFYKHNLLPQRTVESQALNGINYFPGIQTTLTLQKATEV
jgi:hypothetical protein